ncbi:hypothetical protein ETAE_0580 [Edwardsiella piscicida]|uniref:Uncharacterized protein n=1 Tax=Edwardsiella piscicida TaxID=1263550 RepID=A0AAU8P1G5_EDWPI|nr:hypothetical protein ETAE_0580 [Edwardsiella tarda EIB202]
MDQAFVCLTVNDRLHVVVRCLSSCFVASSDSCVYFLDESTHHGTTASIVLATLFRLNGAFLS